MNQTTPGTNDPTSLFSNPVSPNRYAIFVSIAFLGMIADLVTKQVIFAKYFDKNADFAPRPAWFIEPWLGIQTSTNQGALFGLGQGWTVGFAVLSVIALAVLIYLLFFCGWGNDLLITVTFGMLAAGILGNLYDRLGLWHDAHIADNHKNAVRDWIYFNWENGPKFMNPWPNFNIADCLLVCGCILLCFFMMFIQPKMEVLSHTQPREDEH